MIELKKGRKPTLLQEIIAKSFEKVIQPIVGGDGKDMSLIENNPELQRQELEKCKNDVIYFICNYCWTYDPRADDPSQREVLFNLFPKQIETVYWIRERRRLKQDGIIEKARDSGISCLCGAVAVHGWLFENGFKCGFGSYKEEKVDRIGDMDSLFEKLRYVIRKLPPWMKPRGLKEKEHLLHCRLMNPENGSAIIGEIGDNIGRGGRNLLYFVDESAFLEHPDLAEASLSANTPCRIDISTPNGIGNWFYQKRHNLPPEQVHTFHWSDDPRKTEEWKEKTIAEKGVLIFEREYNLNYSASLEGICIPANWVASAINLDLPEIGDLVMGFDVAAEGDNFNVLAPRRGPKVRDMITWKGIDTTQSAHIAAENAERQGAVTVFYDCVGPGEGIKGAWNAMANDQGEGGGLPFDAVAVVGGEACSKIYTWADGKSSNEKFINVRAEMWWIMRVRFQKTYEYVLWMKGDQEKGKLHPIEDLISIPNDRELIAQLSMPLIVPNSRGKVQVESKVQMRKRGIKSPDRADALAYSMYPSERRRKFWFVEVGGGDL
jgi:phage terminase large subunit